MGSIASIPLCGSCLYFDHYTLPDEEQRAPWKLHDESIDWLNAEETAAKVERDAITPQTTIPFIVPPHLKPPDISNAAAANPSIATVDAPKATTGPSIVNANDAFDLASTSDVPQTERALVDLHESVCTSTSKVQLDDAPKTASTPDTTQAVRALVDLDELALKSIVETKVQPGVTKPLQNAGFFSPPVKKRLKKMSRKRPLSSELSNQKTLETETICILGQGGVGKSTLAIRLVAQDKWIDYHDPTIEDVYKTNLCVDGKTCNINVVDTAGHEEYKDLRDTWIRENNLFVLVYSVNDRQSFHEIKEVKLEIDMCKLDDKKERKVILVGNKADSSDARERKVPKADGAMLAKEWGCRFTECSAKDAVNCNRPFHEMIRSIRSSKGFLMRKRNPQAKCCYVM
jgi:GTPase KRas protein